MDDHDIILRLKWRQTWADKENDFTAEAPTYQGTVGRIYLHEAGPQQGQWFWSMVAHGSEVSRNVGILSGFQPSPRRAAKEVEDSWAAAIRGTIHEQGSKPSSPMNAYAAAKGI